MSNKWFNIIKLVILVVILFLLILFSIGMFKGTIGMFTVSKPGGKADYSESFMGVSAINADLTSASLRISEWEGSDTVVNIYIRGLGASSMPTVELDGSTLNITSKQILSIGLFNQLIVEVNVPAGSANNYKLSSNSGAIKLDAESKVCSIMNTSGSIKVYKGGDTLSINAVSGSVKVYEAFKKSNISCVSGSIKAVAGKITESLFVDAKSGAVKIALYPGSLGYRFDFSTVSGSISDEYNHISFDKRGSYSQGDESAHIEVEAISGSIKLCDWSD